MPEISRRNNSTIRRVQNDGKQGSEEPRALVRGDLQRVNSALVIVMILMLAFGMVCLFSASMSAGIYRAGSATNFLNRQLFANMVGIIFIVVLTRANIKAFDKPKFAIFVYIISNFLLIATYFFPPINGSRRWIPMPIVGQFQPSEFTKVVLVYSIACYFSWLNKQRAAGRFPRFKGFKGAWKDAWRDVFIPAIIVGIPAGITLWQPHFSGFIIMAIIGVVSLLAAGIPFRSWAVGLVTLLSLVIIGLTVFTVLEPILPEDWRENFAHVETRINVYTGNGEATEAEIYQSRQSRIAMGSGGLFGVGLGQGRQKNNYLPEGHNDYIFSNIVEELGFVGGMAILLLFIVFFLLGLRVTFHANSIYAQIVAGGISSLIIVQAILNIAVNVGVVPATGISLPFFSYGGTSNMFFLIGIGLLLNVSKYGVSRKEIHSPERKIS